MDKEELKIKYDITDNFERKAINIPNFNLLEGIILIVGSSGSGKSTILNTLYEKGIIIKENELVIDNFENVDLAEKMLMSCGLRSIPTWFQNVNQLSNGERHRAEVAIGLAQDVNIIDEFTSVVDRNTAKSLSCSIRKFHKSKEKLFIATCHRDVEEWLCPDHVYDTDLQEFVSKRYLRRPSIKLDIKSSNKKDWKNFSKHHYLDGNMAVAVHCYGAYINGEQVAFYAVMFTISPQGGYWRGSRLVVLPEWQGFGIGTKFSDVIAEFYTSKGHRFYAKTAHMSLGEHREKSPNWRATSSNKKSRMTKGNLSLENNSIYKLETLERDVNRVCYSHEYMNNKEFKKENPFKEFL